VEIHCKEAMTAIALTNKHCSEHCNTIEEEGKHLEELSR